MECKLNIDNNNLLFNIKSFQSYAVTLAKQLGVKKIREAGNLGKPISEDLLNNLRDDQIQQLYELMVAAQDQTEKENM